MDMKDKVLSIAEAEMKSGGSNKKEVWGSNDGPQVRKYLESVGIYTPSAWCAAFVHWCIREAARQQKIEIEIPKTGYCPDLAAWGKEKKIIDFSSPEKGDIFLLMDSQSPPYYHTGFVQGYNKNTGEIWTIEGNTNTGGSANGDGIYERVRWNSNIAFVKWWKLLNQKQEEDSGNLYIDNKLIDKLIIKDGVAYAPVKKLCKAVGYNVEWNSENKSVYCSKK